MYVTYIVVVNVLFILNCDPWLNMLIQAVYDIVVISKLQEHFHYQIAGMLDDLAVNDQTTN